MSNFVANQMQKQAQLTQLVKMALASQAILRLRAIQSNMQKGAKNKNQ